MSPDPSPNLNPYSPPTSDTDGAIWPNQRELGDQRPADRGTRLGAAVIDALLYLATLIPALVIVMLMRSREVITIAVLMVALGILPLAIYQWYLVATTGQSLAKKWLRIRIVKNDGSPVDFMSGVFLRVWVPWLILQGVGFAITASGNKDNFTWIFSLIDCLWIFGAPSRCVHDLIAGTKVVTT